MLSKKATNKAKQWTLTVVAFFAKTKRSQKKRQLTRHCLRRYKANMIRIALFLFSVFSFQVSANDKCDQVVAGYESNDVMYVICKDLAGFTLEQANQKLKSIFDQYQGEPDEILVYFVSNLKSVGKPKSIGQPLG